MHAGIIHFLWSSLSFWHFTLFVRTNTKTFSKLSSGIIQLAWTFCYISWNNENPRNFKQLWHSMFIMAVPTLKSSVLIYLTPTASISTVVLSCLLQPVLKDCNSLLLTYLYHSVTWDWYGSINKPTDCSSLTPSVLNSLLTSTASNSYDIIPVSDLKQQQAVTALWRFYVCIVQFFIGNVDNTIRHPDKLVMFIVIKLQMYAAVFFPIVPHV